MDGIRQLWKTEEVLIGLDRCGGEATTSEIRENCALEKTAQVRYQLKRNLSPEGYIELYQPDPENGRPQAKVATLTERGIDLVAEVREARGGDETLESTLGELSSKMGEISQRLAHLEERVDTVEGASSEIEELSDEIAELKSDDWGGLNEDALDIIARLRGSVRAYQKFINEHVGHNDELRAQINSEVMDVYDEMGLSR